MEKQYIYILMVFALFFSCEEKNKEIELTDNFKANVLDEILNNSLDSLVSFSKERDYLSNSSLRNRFNLIYFDSLSKTFKEESSPIRFISKALNTSDSLLIIKQIRSNEDFNFDIMSKFNYNILDVKGYFEKGLKQSDIDTIVNMNYDEIDTIRFSRRYLSLSKPIFNHNKTEVFLRILLGSSGYNLVFEKVNKKWELKRVLENWIE